MSSAKTQCKPLTRIDEIQLLESDDERFSNTKKYLAPLIERALDRFILPLIERQHLVRALTDDIPVAAKRFLTSATTRAADYTFATYFTWYIAQRLNTTDRRRK